jgi:hypothetical protein
MASLGVERIAFIFVQRGAEDVGRNIDSLSGSLLKLQATADSMGASNNAIGNVAGLFNAMGEAGAKLITVGAGVTLGAAAVARFGGEFMKLGGSAIVAKQQFENTSLGMGSFASDLLPRLQRATLNTVSDMDLMRSANRALASGIQLSEGDFVRLTEAATKLAMVHGRDVPDAIERMTMAIAKHQPRMLAELGVVIQSKDVFKEYAESVNKAENSLTSQEKVQAFFMATMKAAEAQTAGFTGVNFELASVGERLSAAFSNFGNKLAEAFVQGGHAERMFNAINHVLGNIMDRLSQPGRMKQFFDGIINAVVSLIQLAEKVLNLLITMVPYAERLLKAFIGMQIASAGGNIAAAIASMFGPAGVLIGQVIKVGAPLVGAAAGLLSGSDAFSGAQDISDAIEPRLAPTESMTKETTSILRNMMINGAPDYGPAIA